MGSCNARVLVLASFVALLSLACGPGRLDGATNHSAGTPPNTGEPVPPTDEGADAGTVIVVLPPADTPDAGTPDAGAPDAGTPDAGTTQPPPPPVKHQLGLTWQGESPDYYCGPASTRIALSTRQRSLPSQSQLATELHTTVAGTDDISNVIKVLNARLAPNQYHAQYILGSDATAAQVAQLRTHIVDTLSKGFPMVANVVSGWRPPGYPSSGTIYHYVAIVGYDQSGNLVEIADPAGGCAIWCTVPKTYWLSTTNLGTWIAGKGYAYRN